MSGTAVYKYIYTPHVQWQHQVYGTLCFVESQIEQSLIERLSLVGINMLGGSADRPREGQVGCEKEGRVYTVTASNSTLSGFKLHAWRSKPHRASSSMLQKDKPPEPRAPCSEPKRQASSSMISEPSCKPRAFRASKAKR